MKDNHMNNSHKPLPQFDSEDEEREFWAMHDSTEYVDWSRAERSSAFPHLKLSIKEGPQGIGAVVHQRWERLDEVRLTNELCWVALDAAQDPGNIGTILRTSDAVGCAGLILLGNSADPYDPGALRASMGAVFSQRLVKANFAE